MTPFYKPTTLPRSSVHRSMTRILKYKRISRRGSLLKIQIFEPHPGNADSAGPEKNSGVWVVKSLPADSDGSEPQTRLREALPSLKTTIQQLTNEKIIKYISKILNQIN